MGEASQSQIWKEKYHAQHKVGEAQEDLRRFDGPRGRLRRVFEVEDYVWARVNLFKAQEVLDAVEHRLSEERYAESQSALKELER